MKLQHPLLLAASAIAVVASLSISRPSNAAGQAGASSQSVGLPPAGDFTRVPLGDFAEHPGSDIAADINNPYAGQTEAVQQGKLLFAEMNCADCHGFDAKGGMGPNLTGKYWRYGGTPAAIYKSIYEGRPQGMPAWGRVLPKESIWIIVAYIQSLGGSFPANAYQPSLQGDRPGELVAPELAFEQGLDGLATPSARPRPEERPSGRATGR
jgi:cytochrome c oxidase cbb3-type subunit III